MESFLDIVKRMQQRQKLISKALKEGDDELVVKLIKENKEDAIKLRNAK